MRIVAGSLGGRLFDAPGSFRTHPMSDKARGALFNILGDLEDLTVLDPFAGSGALSFEAVSRGAKYATAIEVDRPAQRVIATNIAALELKGRVQLIAASANAWLQTNPQASFDLVLCDPPYNDLQRSLLAGLARTVKPQGLFVLSWPAATEVPDFAGLEKLEHRHYGDATLVFYRKLS